MCDFLIVLKFVFYFFFLLFLIFRISIKIQNIKNSQFKEISLASQFKFYFFDKFQRRSEAICDREKFKKSKEKFKS
jgi:hypothetical protein